jgi:hypothetical protein
MSAFCLGQGKSMQETDITFLRRQAELCVALSRATFDLTVAGRLRAMADEFRTRASHWEHDIDHMPAHVVRRNGSLAGKLDRS